MKKYNAVLRAVILIFVFVACLQYVYSQEILVDGEGRVTLKVNFISKIPDPQKAPYEDCLVVAKASIVNESGNINKTDVLIAFWVFLDRIVEPLYEINEGDMVSGKLVEYNRAGKKVTNSMLIDETEDYDSVLYYLESPQILNSTHEEMETVEKLPGYITAAAEESLKKSKAFIQADIEAIDRELAEAGYQSFQEVFNALRPFREELKGLKRKGISLKRGDILFDPMIAQQVYNLPPITSDTIPDSAKYIMKISEYYTARGVRFIFVPTPNRELITANVFFEDLGKLSTYCPRWDSFIYTLLKGGVEVVDPVPHIRENYYTYKNVFFPNSDQHPAFGFQILAAEILANRLKSDPRVQSAKNAKELSLVPRSISVADRFAQRGFMNNYLYGQELSGIQVVKWKSIPLKGDIASKIRFYGSSYLGSLEVRGIVAADLWAHAAYLLGKEVSYYFRGGADPEQLFELSLRDIEKYGADIVIFHLHSYILLPSESVWIPKFEHINKLLEIINRK